MKSAKKIISLIAVMSLLVTSFCAFSVSTASAATTTVKLHSTEINYTGRGYTSRNVYIAVKNPASNAKVYVHYQTYEGQAWSDAQATKTNLKASDGSTIWTATFGSFSTKYAIKYVGGGKTLWDNNGGKDYTYQNIGNGVNVKAEPSFSPLYGTSYNVVACVRNIAYQKTVKAKYTTDNWKTTKYASLTFSNMNDFDNSERWTGYIEGIKDSSKFKFAIVYTVSGKTYTDNNFGQYYNGGYYIHR